MINRLGSKYPYGYFGVKYHKIINKYVIDYLNVYYPNKKKLLFDPKINKIIEHINDNNLFSDMNYSNIDYNTIVEIMTNYIVQVTGIHSFVGDIFEYFVSPNFMSIRTRPNINSADLTESTLILSIYLISSDNIAKITDDYSFLLLKDTHYNQTMNIYNTFKKDLLELSQEINNTYNGDINIFNPTYLSISSSY